MKRFILGSLLGLTLGAALTWWRLHDPTSTADSTAPQSDAASAADEEDDAVADSTVTLTAHAVALAGIELTSPESVSVQETVTGFARVVDPAPLFLLRRERDIAIATQVTAQRELDRLRTLHAANDNVSTRAVEIAEADLAREAGALATIQDRLRWEWGVNLTDAAALDALLQRLHDSASALVRVDLMAGDNIDSAPVTLVFEESPDSVGRVIGPAPQSDTQLQGAAWWVELPLTSPVGAGKLLHARVPRSQTTRQAWWVPAAAVLRHEGHPWVFVAENETTFERRAVTLGRRQRGGEVVLSGVTGDERIVSVGAQQILSAGLSSNAEED